MKEYKNKEKLIIAIDISDFNQAVTLCNTLKGYCGLFKLGMEFFFKFGVEGVNKISQIGTPIFLDLKLHDIPNTVSNALFALLSQINGVEMITLHASGGVDMLTQAKKKIIEASIAYKKPVPKIFGVTILTSIISPFDSWENERVVFPYAMIVLRAAKRIIKFIESSNSAEEKITILSDFIPRIKFMVNSCNNNLIYWSRLSEGEKERLPLANKELLENPIFSPLNLQLKCQPGTLEFYNRNTLNIPLLNDVVHYAAASYQAQLDGIVCSAIESSCIKALFPELKVLNPGIRPSWNTDQDDQARKVSPKQALCNGADYIVVGRPITLASSPLEAVKMILEELNT